MLVSERATEVKVAPPMADLQAGCSTGRCWSQSYLAVQPSMAGLWYTAAESLPSLWLTQHVWMVSSSKLTLALLMLRLLSSKAQ